MAEDATTASGKRFGWLTLLLLSFFGLLAGALVGHFIWSGNPIHLPPLPTLKEFVVSSGLGGAMAVVAAIVAACAAVYSVKRTAKSQREQLTQQDRHHTTDLEQLDRHYETARKDENSAAAITRCWDRLVWLVKTASAEPAAVDAASASLRLGPELAHNLLQLLEHDAQRLEDVTLQQAVNSYVTQFGLVLVRQMGKHAQPAQSAAEVHD